VNKANWDLEFGRKFYEGDEREDVKYIITLP
jgi:hypothetical protein